MAQPVLARSEVEALIEERFGQRPQRLQPLSGGLIASTFSFAVAGEEYVIRIHAQVMGANFEKEAYIAQYAASEQVPIPAILHAGRWGARPFAISRKAPGRRMDTLSPEEVEALLPALMETLDAIHRISIPGTAGYGFFDDRGRGAFPSWAATMSAIKEEDPEWDFYGKWHRLFDETFLERDLFDRIYRRMLDALARCPEERTLVHSDFGYGNLLVDGGKVTAVLDWIDARYGDPLFDVARLDFWDPEREYARRFRLHYDEIGADLLHFDERVLCYQCYTGLDALRFFAKTRNEGAYRWTRDRLLSL